MKLLFRDDLKLKKNELHLEGFFNFCSSLIGRFPKFVVFIIMSSLVVEVYYYNLTLWNLKENKRFHRRVETDTTFMWKELITSNGHIFFFTIVCINFSILYRTLVSVEHSTLQKYYLCEN